MINKNVETKDTYKYYDKLVNKAGLAKTFNRFLIDEGYPEMRYYSSNQKGGIIVGNTREWENKMEAIALEEKKQKENTEQVFKEFQNYSKGAK